MGLNFQERIARQPRFDPKNIGVGGPVVTIISCSAANNNNFRKGYDEINWKGSNHENNMPEVREEVPLRSGG